MYNIPNDKILEEQVFKDYARFLNEYNKFKDIDEEQYEKIKVLATEFKERIFNESAPLNYIKTLQYLFTTGARQKLYQTKKIVDTRDSLCNENLTFIILCCDPECNLYKSYLKCPNNLTTFQKENYCRNESGFFNKKVLFGEKDFYTKFINLLITEVNKDFTEFLNHITINSFDNITNERFEEINTLAQINRKNIKNNSYIQTSLFNILFQSNILNLITIEEKLAYFIASSDPDLLILTIYEEECMMGKIKKRIIDEFGIYHSELINLEKKYKDCFYPKKELSEWTKTLKK